MKLTGVFSIPPLIVALVASLFGQGGLSTEQVYRRPPESITEVVDAPFTPVLSVSPGRSTALILNRPGLPGIDEVSKPELRLAGVRINPKNNGPSRIRYFDGMILRALRGGEERIVNGLPEDAKISNVVWAPDGSNLAMLLTFSDRLELWGVEVSTAMAGRLMELPINASYGDPFAQLHQRS